MSAIQTSRPAGQLSGIPLTDWLRDGAAFVLLLVSLALPWTAVGVAAGRIEVVLITILSVLSLSISYLARFGVFGPGVTLSGVWLVRTLANVPYVVLVLVYLILDAVGVGSVYGYGPGVGAAAMIGLAGAVLAAQPRQFELTGQPHGAAIAQTWYRILVGCAVVVGVFLLLGLVLTMIAFAGPGSNGWVVAGTLFLVLTLAAVVAVTFAVLLRRSEVGRTIILGVSIAAVVVVLIDACTGFTLDGLALESVRAGGYVWIWFGLLLGLTASPALALAMRPIEPLARWFTVAVRSAFVLVIVGGFFALTVILGFFGQSVNIGVLIGQLLAVAAAAVLGLLARQTLFTRPGEGKSLVLGLFGGIAALGIVVFVLAIIAADQAMSGLLFGSGFTILLRPTVVLATLVGLPIIAVSALLVPGVVRDYFRQFAGAVSAAGSGYPVSVGYAVTAYTAAQAANPATSPQDLYAMAQADAALWPHIAANPSAYPDLLTWLESTGDAVVIAAIRARGTAAPA